MSEPARTPAWLLPRERWRASSRMPSWLSWPIVIDWIVVLGLVIAEERTGRWKPFEHPLGNWLDDPSLQYPHVTHEHVPVAELWLLTYRLPLLVIVLVSAVRLSVHELHFGALAFLLTFEFTQVSTNFVKNFVGRLRPDFFARCMLEAGVCTGPASVVEDGRRSFPSGHSSAAWSAGVFMLLFFAGRSRAFCGHPMPSSNVLQSKLLRAGIAISPLFVSAYIAISRWEDHRHHPTDILAGSLLGTIIALAGHSMFFPWPFFASNFDDMPTPRSLYEVKPAAEAPEPDIEAQGGNRLGP